MRALLVTSQVHFVPQNYDDFILPLLRSPHIAGLLTVNNRTPDLLIKASTLIATAAAPGFGFQVWQNYWGSSQKKRESEALIHGKSFLLTPNPNSAESLQWIQQNKFDLILHARTRSFLGARLLEATPLGALNIHHGLLPHQRGLMCDFWSLTEGRQAGFSVHVMTRKLDDGPILKAVPVPYTGKNYREYLKLSTRLETETCLELLQNISENKSLPTAQPNVSDSAVYRKNPKLLDFYKMQF